MRCPSCEKFTGLDLQDPEVDDIDITENTVTASVRIVRCCAECGDELKESMLDMEATLEKGDESGFNPAEHVGDKHELSVDEEGVDQIEEGGGRYAKSYFGAEISFSVHCSCDPMVTLVEGTMSAKVAASAMDELV